MELTSGHGPITLETNKVIGSGGEAKVYAVKGDRSVVAKVYHHPTIDRGNKLRAMVGHAPADPGRAQGHVSIAWPEDVLFDPTGLVVGYLMPAIQGSYPLSDVYHPAARRQSLPVGFGYQYLLRTAHNLCAAVSAVHDMGYVIGDLNECNILVQADARVTLIDCDSFQVGPHRCLVGRPEYTAPELQGSNLSIADRKAEQDCFALAVLVYQLLMSGFHPYAGVGEPGELGERIKSALCPHAQGGPKPPRGAPQLKWLPASLQQMVRAAFVDGHTVPSARPEARAWAEQLSKAENKLATCRRDRSHPHFNHLPKCPACQVKTARPRQTRKAQTAPVGGRPRQQPLPGLHVRSKGSVRRRFVLLVVLIAFFMLAYNWPSLRSSIEQLATQSGAYPGNMGSASIYSQGASVSPARKLRKLETGSEIYRKHIGESPYQRPNGVGQAGTGLPNERKRASNSDAISPGQQKHDLETGSEIYRQYIGKNPY